MDEWLEYRPNFFPYHWTEEDKKFLQPFFTNINEIASVIHNLPPEIVGALCSRASRASKSLLEVFLDEYIYPIVNGEDKILANELKYTIQFLLEHGFQKILNNQRAQSFYIKWLAQYGDDSIAQMTGTHFVFWGISQVAIKFIEDQRIGLEPIEKSTRYVNFSQKINDKFLYYIPQPDLEKMNLLDEYKTYLDNLFKTYIKLQPLLLLWLKQNFNEKDSILEKKSFDVLRGLLPMATVSQLALRGNAQAFEYLVNRTIKHNLGELRWVGNILKQELNKEIPSLLLRVEEQPAQQYQQYLAQRTNNVKKAIANLNINLLSEDSNDDVKLVEYDEDAEDKIITAILFETTNNDWKSIYQKVKKLNNQDKKQILMSYFNGRTERWQKVGRALENSYLRFEIVTNIGAYRDLHRHRMMTQQRQLFSIDLGYYLPPEIKAANLSNDFESVLNQAAELFLKIKKYDEFLAQYVVPLAYKIRFYQFQNFRELFWESELRTSSQGHPDYRKIEQKKYLLIKEKFPLIASLIKVDLNDYDISRRGTEEKIKAKEEMLLKKLK
ncbi:MAG: FAD-dependent thymidylate synthase [Minisyncoccia bacterium]